MLGHGVELEAELKALDGNERNRDVKRHIAYALERNSEPVPAELVKTVAECMDRGTFRHAGVVRRMNQTFVALKIDADEQPMLIQRLRVSAFPSLLVVTPQRHLLAKQQGHLSPVELHQFLTLAVKQAETAERR
ncbi:MAG TPA: hypothetical protein VNH11_16540 [Pirellulales bacterium]|nr:hypothetical protein [Pirellulales bacterium]